MMKLIIRKIRRLFIFAFLYINKVANKIAIEWKKDSVVGSVEIKKVAPCKLSLSGAVIVVSGSSRGIGFAVAKAFLDAGSRVVINGRNQDSLKKALKKLEKYTPNVLSVNADVSTPNGAKKIIDKALKKFGKIDVLINNAAVSSSNHKKIWELSGNELQQILQTNIIGPFLCSKEVIQWAKKNRHHIRIINVSSGIVDKGDPYLGAYTISKMGLEGLTKSIANDAIDDRLISIVSIKPRSVRTYMTKSFFPKKEYLAMDYPDVLAPVFLYAATAQRNEILGKSLDEPCFSADPGAAITMENKLPLIQPLKMQTPVYRSEYRDKGGAYMHFLQNSFGFCPSVVEVLSKMVNDSSVHQYPDPNYTQLREAISAYLNVDPSDISFGTGSSELIDRAIRIFASKSGNIIITKPTWAHVVWPSCIKYDFLPIEVPYTGSIKRKNIKHDLQGILDAINDWTKLVYLVNPCNPTGSIVEKEELRSFLRQIPSHITVLIDEAYIEFCEPEKRLNLALEYKEVNCRLISLRTFSKFFALSGFRVGYAYGNPDTINYLERLSLTFNLSSMSQLAASTALKDKAFQEKVYKHNFSERKRICEELDRMDIPNMPSQTNFIVFDCPMDRDKMRREMMKDGIFMPNIDAALGGNLTATTVGLYEHNQKILNLLSKY
jgi:histidinol-phosphate aminotransferase